MDCMKDIIVDGSNPAIWAVVSIGAAVGCVNWDVFRGGDGSVVPNRSSS